MFLIKSYKESPFESLLDIDLKNNSVITSEINRIFKCDVLKDVVHEFLRLVSNNESIDSLTKDTFDPNYTWIQLRVARSKTAQCSLNLYEGAPQYGKGNSFLTANDIVIGFYGTGECEAITFQFEEMKNYEIFDVDRRLVKEQKVKFRSGDILSLNAGIHGFVILKIKDLVLFEVKSFEHHKIVWNFDIKTRKMTYPSSADISSSRQMIALEALKSIGDKESKELITRLATEHHQHFVRWAAIQAMGTLDEKEAKRLLKLLATDSHPDVRNAALQTLKLNGIR